MKLILAAALLLLWIDQSPQVSQQISITREGPATVKIASQSVRETISSSDQTPIFRITCTTVTLQSKWISPEFFIKRWLSRYANAYAHRVRSHHRIVTINNKYILTNDK